MIHNKIIDYTPHSLNQLGKNKKTVLVGGCFDVLHIGHVTFLEKAKAAGDILIVALEPDEYIVNVKKKKPIHSQEMRGYILSHLDLVDYVIMLPLFKTSREYQEMVELIRPKVIALTKGDPYLLNKKSQAKQINAHLVEIDQVKTFSSSMIAQYETISRN